MRLPQCLLLATYLSTGVSAFYPYIFKLTASLDGDRKASEKLQGRFFPWILENDVEDDGVSLPKLELKKLPKNAPRDNNYALVKGDEPSMAHSVSIDNDGHDLSYFSTVKFGSKGQEMLMLLDTGGTNTWVFGSDCKSQACQQHNTFGDKDSTTLKIDTDPWKVGYGSGAVSGVLANDTVSFAGFDLEMTFGLALNATDDFCLFKMDGILGLARSDGSETGTPTFMDMVADSKMLKSNIIGISLSRTSDGVNDGEMTFGDVDKTKYLGDITYTGAATNLNRWQIPVDDAGVDGKACNFTGKSAIIDTGTSYILIPLEDAVTLHALIPGSSPKGENGENFVVPCDSTAKVQLTFSGVTYDISPKDYIGGPADSSGKTCLSTIIGHQIFGPDDWLVGDVFLKNVYSVFDFDNNQVGFARRAPPTTTTTAAANPTAAPPSETTSSDAITTGSAVSAVYAGAAAKTAITPSLATAVLTSSLWLSPVLAVLGALV
ncbi:hypothetical protein VTN00DRAFT_1376 [Thermoascus crustaceus]|uniref:uncharacterized protein n=1 Tax=Thermoascus crustaceus TaxID=5088 RepID=UPI0037449319